MKVRVKMILAICTTCLFTAMALFFIQQSILATRFAKLEKDSTSQNVDRALSAVAQDVSSVATAAADWGVWDDTYLFVQDGNQDYVMANFQDSSFISLRMNLIAVINSSGAMVHGETFDTEAEEEVPIPTDLQACLVGESLLTQHQDEQSSIAGILPLAEGPMLIASQAILTSEGEGPVQGSLIMGRYIDSLEVQRLAELTHLSIVLHRVQDDDMPEDFQLAQSTLSEGEPIYVRPLNEDAIAGYGLLADIQGNPALVLRIDQARDIYAQGQQTTRYVVLSVTALSLLAGLFLMFLIDRLLLSRLARLRVDVETVGTTRDLAGRVAAVGRDELAEVAQAINKTLSSLEQSEQELVASEARNRALVDALPDTIFRVRRDGTLLDRGSAKANPVASGGYESLSERGGTCREWEALPKEILERILPHVTQTVKTGKTELIEFQISVNSHVSHYEARVVANGADEALVIVRDITEKKHEEEARRRGLLLKEIHHRVKNNLQVVSSLLYLESMRVADKNVIEMFRESGNRVQSMSLIHQKLYQSKDADSIDFGGYVRDLASALLLSYGVDESAVKVKLNIDGSLGMDSAVPCGLIINELLSNSLKHAFPGGRSGEVLVEMTRDATGRVKLLVADNGVGIRSDLDLQNAGSLGLQLVVNLVGQLGGVITLNREHGTEFAITFAETRCASLTESGREQGDYSVTLLS